MTRIVRGLVVPMAALVFLLSGPSGATGATITLSDVTDGFAMSIDNFQTASPPQIGVPFLQVTKFGTDEARAALEFDLSSLPASAVVTSASLELSFTVSDALIGVNGATGDGLITPADFTFPAHIATFDPNPGLNTVDVTSFIAAWSARTLSCFSSGSSRRTPTRSSGSGATAVRPWPRDHDGLDAGPDGSAPRGHRARDPGRSLVVEARLAL